MRKVILSLMVALMSVPAFASSETVEYVDPMAETSDVALERGLIPADLLDAAAYAEQESGSEANVEALLQRRPGPGPRPGDPRRPGPGRPDPRRPDPRRPEPRREWRCEARDRQGRVYTGRDRDQGRARREAVQTCERRARRGDCRLIGCR